VAVVCGDLRYDLVALAEQAPADATLVIFHTAVLGYVRDAADRRGLARSARAWRSLDRQRAAGLGGHAAASPTAP
jgi:hypothetical protein